MELRFFHFYPDLMNLYGSHGNAAILKRLLEELGHTVTVRVVLPGEEVSLRQADFVYMGAGTEHRARIAMSHLAAYRNTLKSAAANGVPMLFSGTAMELLGQVIVDRAGEPYLGLGLGSFSTTHVKRRIVGDVMGHCPLCGGPVVGFMNKCARITDVETPLLTSLDMGFGNAAAKGPEGFHVRYVFASELTGPLLVKNPRLLEVVAGTVLDRRGETAPEVWPTDMWAEKGYTVTVRELQVRLDGARSQESRAVKLLKNLPAMVKSRIRK